MAIIPPYGQLVSNFPDKNALHFAADHVDFWGENGGHQLVIRLFSVAPVGIDPVQRWDRVEGVSVWLPLEGREAMGVPLIA